MKKIIFSCLIVFTLFLTSCGNEISNLPEPEPEDPKNPELVEELPTGGIILPFLFTDSNQVNLMNKETRRWDKDQIFVYYVVANKEVLHEVDWAPNGYFFSDFWDKGQYTFCVMGNDSIHIKFPDGVVDTVKIETEAQDIITIDHLCKVWYNSDLVLDRTDSDGSDISSENPFVLEDMIHIVK